MKKLIFLLLLIPNLCFAQNINSGSPAAEILDDGVSQGRARKLDFTGGIEAAVLSGTATISADIADLSADFLTLSTPQQTIVQNPIFSTGLTLTAGQDIRPTANSTTALNIAQADGTDFGIFDTTNKRFGLSVTPTATLTIQGAGATSATKSLLVTDSAAATLLSVQDNNIIQLGAGTVGTTANTVQIGNTTESIIFNRSGATVDCGNDLSVRSTGGNNGLILKGRGDTGTSQIFMGFVFPLTKTSGTLRCVDVDPSFAPTSGTSTFATMNIKPTINQTGGASGITRGIYINPTLTAAADWRSIEVVSGDVLFGGDLTFTVAASGIILKQGANGKCGTFVANGATPVTVSNTSIAITDTIMFSLNTVGGTVGAYPTIQTITAATGFTVAATAGDTSTYNYAVISNAA